MGADVIYTARTAKPHLPYAFVQLDELLGRADVVSLHVPLSDDRRHLLNATRFARMRRSSVLVNTARGAWSTKHALVAALDQGRIAGAGLDVFDSEPVASTNPLSQRDVWRLLHTSRGSTRETLQRSLDAAVANRHRLGTRNHCCTKSS